MDISVKIVGGTVVDPEQGFYGEKDIYIQGNRIVSPQEGELLAVQKTINAQGCLSAN